MWQVFYGEELIYDARDAGLTLLGMSGRSALNEAGEFTFTVPPEHPFWGRIACLQKQDEVRVYSDAELVFCGRAMRKTRDFANCETYTCEGERAYLNDVLVPPYSTDAAAEGVEIAPASVDGYFAWLIGVYNAKVAPEYRFAVGANSDGSGLDNNDYIARASDTYPTVWSELREKIVGRLGGMVRTYHDGGQRFIELLSDGGRANAQKIEFGENLLDFAREQDHATFVTAVVPLGEDGLTISELPDGLISEGAMTLEKQGLAVVWAEGVAQYGYIEGKLESGATTAAYLLSSACRFLANQLVGDRLDVTAVDLSLIDATLSPIRVGDYVRCVSTPHGFDEFFLCAEAPFNPSDPAGVRYILGNQYETLSSNQQARMVELNSSIDKSKTDAQQARDEAAEAHALAQQASTAAQAASNAADSVSDTAASALEAANDASAAANTAASAASAAQATATAAQQSATAASDALASIEADIDAAQATANSAAQGVATLTASVGTMQADYSTASATADVDGSLFSALYSSVACLSSLLKDTSGTRIELSDGVVVADYSELLSYITQTSTGFETLISDMQVSNVDDSANTALEAFRAADEAHKNAQAAWAPIEAALADREALLGVLSGMTFTPNATLAPIQTAYAAYCLAEDDARTTAAAFATLVREGADTTGSEYLAAQADYETAQTTLTTAHASLQAALSLFEDYTEAQFIAAWGLDAWQNAALSAASARAQALAALEEVAASGNYTGAWLAAYNAQMAALSADEQAAKANEYAASAEEHAAKVASDVASAAAQSDIAYLALKSAGGHYATAKALLEEYQQSGTVDAAILEQHQAAASLAFVAMNDAERAYVKAQGDLVRLQAALEAAQAAASNAATAADLVAKSASDAMSTARAAQDALALLEGGHRDLTASTSATAARFEQLYTELHGTADDGLIARYTAAVTQTAQTIEALLSSLTRDLAVTISADGLSFDFTQVLAELEKTSRISIGDDGGVPFIELTPANTSATKLKITSDKMAFVQGEDEVAYISDAQLYIASAVVERSLQFGEFVWKEHSRGNFGVVHRG